MLGLLLTFAAAAGTTGLLPTGAGAAVAAIPFFGASFLATWVGGILVGNALQPPSEQGQSLAFQWPLGATGSAIGVVAWGEVVSRWGASVVGGWPGSLAVTAGVAAMLWLGGFLMGSGMRRFRHRRPDRNTGADPADRAGGDER
jgi:hypothetical protein